MSTRHLEYLFCPEAVAVIGAPPPTDDLSAVVVRNLLNGDFQGPIMPVGVGHRALKGVLSYPTIADLPMVPELAVICAAPPDMAYLVNILGERGTRAAILCTAGFQQQTDAWDRPLGQTIREAAQTHQLRLLGPNSLGILVPHCHLNASLAPLDALPGSVALVHQSGGLGTAMLDWAYSNGLGFSHFISLGESLDIDLSDILDYLSTDPKARAILLYIHSIPRARKFMSAARNAARRKPVLVVKAARSALTASLVGNDPTAADEVFDAAVQRAGMLRVFNTDELFDAVETLAKATPIRGDRLAILGNACDASILAVDALINGEGTLAKLAAETRRKLATVLSPQAWRGNPVDLGYRADAQCYGKTLEMLLNDPQVDAVLVLHTPQVGYSSVEVAQAVVDIAKQARKTLLTSWLGGANATAARQYCAAARVPTYETPEKAVRAFLHLVRYRRNQNMLLETPPSLTFSMFPKTSQARQVIDYALQQSRRVLSNSEVQDLLSAYGIPMVPVPRPDTMKTVHELMVEVKGDPIFGPVIIFGQGGAAGNAALDKAVALPPLNLPLAQELVERTRVFELLKANPLLQQNQRWRDIATALVKISQLIVDIPELVMLSINPWLLTTQGLLASQVHVGLQPTLAVAAARLAIRPYPQELEERFTLSSGCAILVRPIKPEDEGHYSQLQHRLTEDDRYNRYFSGTRGDIPRMEITRLTQIDYDREMAFMATVLNGRGQEEALGVVHTTTDPSNTTAEFAVVVRSDLKGQGLGYVLLNKMIHYCRSRGTQEIVGYVLPGNKGMLGLGERLSFSRRFNPQQELFELRRYLQGTDE